MLVPDENMAEENKITLLPARAHDLNAINQVIESAVMTWDLPERVKKLSLDSYHYTEMDMLHLEMIIVLDSMQQVSGIAAFEEANEKVLPENCHALLLHGLYVLPEKQGQGIGSALLLAAQTWAKENSYDTVLVKAHKDAEAFFITNGMQRLESEHSGQQYAHTLIKKLIS